MYSRRAVPVLKALCLCFGALSLLVGFSYLWTGSSFGLVKVPNYFHDSISSISANKTVESPTKENDAPEEKKPLSKWLDAAPSFIKAIMNPQDGTFNRLDCPALQGNRYEYLRPSQELVNITSKTPKYFFALDLYDCAHILPRLIGSIVETMRYLGPENCALSIVEGRSVDGTYEVLKLMKENITAIGAEYTFVTNEIDPMAKGGNRIEALATLRNQALKPLLDQPHRYDPDTTIIFLNDIALCTEDILELIHQRIAQQADMTCAMDWTYVGDNPTFYDVWIARGMNGDSFFNIPEDGSWDFAWNLFWNNAPTAERLQTEKPFQVFSCWNGVVSFTAKPLWEKNVRFRVSYEGECFQGEPKLFCKDMWYHGYGKIAVIPSVNVEYSDAMAKRIKELKGYVSRWVDTEDASSKIDWQPSPPEKVKCMRSYPDQTWLPWDEQLAEHGVAP